MLPPEVSEQIFSDYLDSSELSQQDLSRLSLRFPRLSGMIEDYRDRNFVSFSEERTSWSQRVQDILEQLYGVYDLNKDFAEFRRYHLQMTLFQERILDGLVTLTLEGTFDTKTFEIPFVRGVIDGLVTVNTENEGMIWESMTFDRGVLLKLEHEEDNGDQENFTMYFRGSEKLEPYEDDVVALREDEDSESLYILPNQRYYLTGPQAGHTEILEDLGYFPPYLREALEVEY
ncbi:MAG: hypothetical protein ACYCQJ_12320 [Nitrososphaerales archaeon]